MSDDPLAPKLNSSTLGRIMSDFRKRQTNGSVVRKRPDPATRPPNRFCKVCTKVWFTDKVLAGTQMMPSFCDECQAELDSGRIAIIVPQTTRHCFVYSFTLAGKGPIIEVSPEVFDKLEAEAKANPEPEKPDVPMP